MLIKLVGTKIDSNGAFALRCYWGTQFGRNQKKSLCKCGGSSERVRGPFRIQLVNFLIEQNKCKIAAGRIAACVYSAARGTNYAPERESCDTVDPLWCEYQIFYVCAHRILQVNYRNKVPRASPEIYLSWKTAVVCRTARRERTSDIITAQPTL